jgi:chitodextrinase
MKRKSFYNLFAVIFIMAFFQNIQGREFLFGKALMSPENTTATANMIIGTNFWDIAWGGSDPWANGYSNAIDPAKVNDPTYNPWNTTFLSEIAFYKCLRFMDFGRTNNNTTEKNWSDRILETNVKQDKMSVFWMIDLCNRVNADMWICIPQAATSDWWNGASALIHSKLKSNLKVYVEYSNEVWNSGFNAYAGAKTAGIALNLWLAGDPHTAGGYGEQRCAARYVSYISTQIWKTFNTTFGTDAARVVKVLSGSCAWTWWNAAEIHAMTDNTLNTTGITPDYFAVAPYFGGGSIDGAAANIVTLMNQEITNVDGQLTSNEKIIDGTATDSWYSQTPSSLHSLKIIGYEGGQGLTVHANTFSSNPAIYQVYIDYLNMLNNHLNGIFNHYNHSGNWGSGGAWGAKSSIGQDISLAHKYRALFDWAAANGTPDTQAPTAPSGLTSTAKTSTSVSLSWTASTDNVMVTGYNIYNGAVLAGTSTGTTYSVTGLTANTAYAFTVKAKDAASNVSSASNSLNVTTSASSDTQAPTAPAGLSSTTKTSTSVSISWTASTDNVGVTGYNIYNGATLVGTSTGTTYNVTGLTANTSYTFTVKAKDAAGNVSTASNSLNVTTSAASDTQAPTAPAGLTSTAKTSTSVSLSWTAATDNVKVTGYNIYNGSTLVGSSTGTTFTVTGLTANTAYAFIVKAKDAAGNVSAASKTLNLITNNSQDLDNNESGITAYPNPANDFIILKNVPEDSKIIFMNSIGNILLETTGTADEQTVSIKELSSGIYFIIIKNAEFNKSIKFIKQ